MAMCGGEKTGCLLPEVGMLDTFGEQRVASAYVFGCEDIGNHLSEGLSAMVVEMEEVMFRDILCETIWRGSKDDGDKCA